MPPAPAQRTAKTPKQQMTPAHKKALAEGRKQSKAVRDYLEALRRNKPKRGRKRTPASIRKRLAAIDDALSEANAIQELELVQERRDLSEELAGLEAGDDLAGLEQGFVDNARAYAERKGISYASFRDVGVPAEVLRRAGITRGS